MDYSIIESKEVKKDIEKITEYMIEELCNIVAAKDFVERILKIL